MTAAVTSQIATTDLSKEAELYLTKAAKKALSNKALSQVVKMVDTGEVFLCTYFAAKVSFSEIDDGIKMVAAEINILASKGLIHSALSNFKRLDLSPETTGYFDEYGNPKEMQTVVLCYVLVPEKTYLELEKEAKKRAKELFGEQ